MQVVYATHAPSGQVNEDFVVSGPTWALCSTARLDIPTSTPAASTVLPGFDM
jgi:hypothetical protein